MPLPPAQRLLARRETRKRSETLAEGLGAIAAVPPGSNKRNDDDQQDDIFHDTRLTASQNIAIGRLVPQLTDNGTLLGIVTATRFVPLILLGPRGGVVADRQDTKRLLIIT